MEGFGVRLHREEEASTIYGEKVLRAALQIVFGI